MTMRGHDLGPRRGFSEFERLPIVDDWFEAYRITEELVVFREPRHFEETIVSLLIGPDEAALIDTGCGIGNLKRAVEQVTEKPVVVINTHSHLDHVCLLDRSRRVLYCGDILLYGPIWTHLEGGSLTDLIASYQKLMGYFHEFDRLMPSHNQPWIDKGLLPEALGAVGRILANEVPPEEIVDPWQRPLHRYSFGHFEILTLR